MPFQDLALYQKKKIVKLCSLLQNMCSSPLYSEMRGQHTGVGSRSFRGSRGVIHVVSGPVLQQEPGSSAKGQRLSANTN